MLSIVFFEVDLRLGEKNEEYQFVVLPTVQLIVVKQLISVIPSLTPTPPDTIHTIVSQKTSIALYPFIQPSNLACPSQSCPNHPTLRSHTCYPTVFPSFAVLWLWCSSVGLEFRLIDPFTSSPVRCCCFLFYFIGFHGCYSFVHVIIVVVISIIIHISPQLK